MKILQIGHLLPDKGGIELGGVATHSWELCLKLKERGHQVFLLAEDNKFTGLKEIEEIKVYGIPKGWRKICYLPTIETIFNFKKFAPHKFSLKNLLSLILLGNIYKKIILNFKPDVIHIHNFLRWPVVDNILNSKIPSVVTVHSPWKWMDVKKNIVQYHLNYCKNLILVSEQMKEEVREENLHYQGSLTVVHNPIDISKFKKMEQRSTRDKLSLPLDKRILLFVGKLIKVKNVEVIIKSLKFMNNDNFLVICGEGEEKSKLVKVTQDLNLTHCVRFEGFIKRDDLVYYYNSSDLLVMPSSAETLGISYLEALSCGVPVIGYYKTIEEINILSKDIKVGEETKPDIKPEKLANIIVKVLNNPPDRQKIISFVWENFSWEKKIEDFEKYYFNLIRE